MRKKILRCKLCGAFGEVRIPFIHTQCPICGSKGFLYKPNPKTAERLRKELHELNEREHERKAD